MTWTTQMIHLMTTTIQPTQKLTPKTRFPLVKDNHQPTTTQPKDNHQPTTTQPKDNHQPTTTQPKDNHQPTTTQPKDNHQPTTTQPKNNHQPTTTQPKDNHQLAIIHLVTTHHIRTHQWDNTGLVRNDILCSIYSNIFSSSCCCKDDFIRSVRIL